MNYILDQQGNPVAEPDLRAWARWFETDKRRVVKQETINSTRVSTVFLGTDRSFRDGSDPILWETLCFGGPLNQEMDRCGGNLEQAEAMHARMVERVKAEGSAA